MSFAALFGMDSRKERKTECLSHISLYFCPCSDEHLESHCSGELAIQLASRHDATLRPRIFSSLC